MTLQQGIDLLQSAIEGREGQGRAQGEGRDVTMAVHMCRFWAPLFVGNLPGRRNLKDLRRGTHLATILFVARGVRDQERTQ